MLKSFYLLSRRPSTIRKGMRRTLENLRDRSVAKAS